MSNVTIIYNSKSTIYKDPFSIKVPIYLVRVDITRTESTPVDPGRSEVIFYNLTLELNQTKTEITLNLTHNVRENFVEFTSGIINLDCKSILSWRNISGIKLLQETSNKLLILHSEDFRFFFTLELTDYSDLTTFKYTNISKTIQSSNLIEEIGIFIPTLFKHNDTEVQIYYQTDNLGVNLGEMICKITSDHSYPNGFPKKLIGYCDGATTTNTSGIDTFYSFKPKLSKILKLEGSTLLDQTNKLNEESNGITIDNYIDNCIFFNNILAYSTLRYMFAGLSNNSIFSCKWLYANNYFKFLRNPENSEFSAAVPLFTEPQKGFDFSDYNKYYRSCPHK
jgi:hypothetical protein